LIQVARQLTALRLLKRGDRVACPYGVFPEPNVPTGVQLLMYNGDRSQTATSTLNEIIGSSSFEVHVAGTFPLSTKLWRHTGC
jgi:NADPH:quinone reductase